MTRRAVVLSVTLLAILFMEARSPRAQARQDPSLPRQDPSLRGDVLTLAQPFVLAGPDVGFRVIRMDGEIPVGQIVVKINGAWIAADVSK